MIPPKDHFHEKIRRCGLRPFGSLLKKETARADSVRDMSVGVSRRVRSFAKKNSRR